MINEVWQGSAAFSLGYPVRILTTGYLDKGLGANTVWFNRCNVYFTWSVVVVSKEWLDGSYRLGLLPKRDWRTGDPILGSVRPFAR